MKKFTLTLMVLLGATALVGCKNLSYEASQKRSVDRQQFILNCVRSATQGYRPVDAGDVVEECSDAARVNI
jgi:hypothetical protein